MSHSRRQSRSKGRRKAGSGSLQQDALATADAPGTPALPTQLPSRTRPQPQLQPQPQPGQANQANQANQARQLPAGRAQHSAQSSWKRIGARELEAIQEAIRDLETSQASSDDDPQSFRRAQNPKSTPSGLPNPSVLRTPQKNPRLSQKQTPRSQRAIRRELVRQQPPSSPLGSRTLGRAVNMASQQGKWREDQILIICPGSQTTMAQLGCSELTPPTHRIPTRMFKDAETNEYSPYHTYKRKKPNATDGKTDDQWEFVEDRDSVEGAIYPLRGGRIVNMSALLAFIDYVHSLLTTTYHNTPIMLMASPQWTRPDCESIARYVFEKTKTPALCLLNSAIAAQYGLKWPTMTIVDIGHEKVDVTCIHEYQIVGHKDLGYPNPGRDISGGEVFTQKLLSLLKDKKLTYDMAEQLKKTPLCEVLPYAPDAPELMELPTDDIAPAATQAASAAPPSADGANASEAPKPATAFGGETENGTAEGNNNEEGVLDVANIVTSGNTREFLAKKEKEKADKAKSKKQSKAQEAESAATKPGRLPNSKRKTNVFHYEELVHEDVEVPIPNGAPKPEAPAATNGDAPAGEGATNKQEEKSEVKSEGAAEANGDVMEVVGGATNTERRTKRVRRDIEVGLERFLFADRYEVNRITDTIYRTIQGIDETYKRTGCWDNIVFVGNGSRLRGLKENVIQTMTARHLISPSTATIFTSELPSNMATPSGTGSQTPTGSFTGQIPTTSSVNPLLQAATTASLGVPGAAQAPGSAAGDAFGSGHHSHGQTPMSIKQAPLPTYLAEWTKNGFEEAMFLGSLVASRLAYCIHNMDAMTQEAQRTMSLNRVDYNEHGPKLIHTHSMMPEA
ncbi:actin-like ATPase domain-containing protein [Hypoxylon sp. FL1284]|nr:actin-like ATPase domain-containing protein [Hypoxylon sp. FL1284]